MKLMKVLLPAGLSAALLLILLVPSAPLIAGEEGKDEEDKKGEEKVRVYTNKDLEKYHGKTGKPDKARIVVNTTAPPPAPGTAPESLYPDEKQQQLAKLRKEIADAQARIADLDRRERSVVNPFLPRPEVSQEEKEAEAGMDSRQIQQKIRAERQELRRRISDLTAELARVSAIPTRPRPESARAGLEPPQPEP